MLNLDHTSDCWTLQGVGSSNTSSFNNRLRVSKDEEGAVATGKKLDAAYSEEDYDNEDEDEDFDDEDFDDDELDEFDDDEDFDDEE